MPVKTGIWQTDITHGSRIDKTRLELGTFVKMSLEAISAALTQTKLMANVASKG